jgi:hypothetical protein
VFIIYIIEVSGAVCSVSVGTKIKVLYKTGFDVVVMRRMVSAITFRLVVVRAITFMFMFMRCFVGGRISKQTYGASMVMMMWNKQMRQQKYAGEQGYVYCHVSFHGAKIKLNFKSEPGFQEPRAKTLRSQAESRRQKAA